jgi:hypothetical protein
MCIKGEFQVKYPYLKMDLLTINPLDVEIVMPAKPINAPCSICRVAGMSIDRTPLRMTIRGVCVNGVQEHFGQQTFFLELEAKALDVIKVMERLYVDSKRCDFKFNSAIIEGNLVRIKLRRSETGRRFDFDCNDDALTPKNTAPLYDGRRCIITVDPNFWFMEERCGMFMKLIDIEF